MPNKAQFIELLSSSFDGDKKRAAAALDAVIDLIYVNVAKGEKVGLTGFGIFEKRERRARTARNPATGATVHVKKTSVPAFRPGAEFRAITSGAKKLAKAPAKKAAPVKKVVAKAPAKKAAPVKKAAPAKKAVPVEEGRRQGAGQEGRSGQEGAREEGSGQEDRPLARSLRRPGIREDVGPSSCCGPLSGARAECGSTPTLLPWRRRSR